MPVLNFTKEEVGTSLDALSVALSEWRDAKLRVEGRDDLFLSGVIEQAETLESRLQAVYDTITWATDPVDTVCETHLTEAEAKRRTAVANMITAEIEAMEKIADLPKGAQKPLVRRLFPISHPVKDMEAAEAAVKSGDLTREEAAAALGIDIDFAEADAQLASYAASAWIGLRRAPWTTLPDVADNNWPIDPIFGRLPPRYDPGHQDYVEVTLNGSPKVGYTIPKTDSATLLDDIRQSARDSLDRLDSEHDAAKDDTIAEADRIDSELQDIAEAVEAAETALNAIKVKIDFNLGGKTTTLEGHSEGLARLLRDMDLAQRSY